MVCDHNLLARKRLLIPFYFKDWFSSRGRKHSESEDSSYLLVSPGLEGGGEKRALT